MRSERRESQLQMVCRRIGKVMNDRNYEIRKTLANIWDMHPNEVSASHQFRKDMLMQYKVTLQLQKGDQTYDEVLVTLERGRSPQQNSLISFAFHIFNDDIALHIFQDGDTPETIKSKVETIVYTFIQTELGFR